MRTLQIKPGKPYDVHVGRGLLTNIGGLLRGEIGPCRLAVISDETVYGIYGACVQGALHAEGFETCKYAFPPGEASKNAATLIGILEFLGKEGMTRTDCIVALGGGVTGDIAGLAAALYLRGVRYVQLPTTLLAMVDSSVGGKTAIDLDAGKNLAGAFHQPVAVYCDCDALHTLPQPVYVEGLAECIKYGAIADAALLRQLSGREGPVSRSNGGKHAGMEEDFILRMIARCIEIKGEIVAEDEFDTGRRRLLNFGHTPGHAVEKLSGYAIAHGQAVAIGMALMARAAYRRGLCDAGCAQSILDAIAYNGLPARCEYTAGQLAAAALSDKKRRGNTIALVVPEQVGCCGILELPVSELQPFFEAGREE